MRAWLTGRLPAATLVPLLGALLSCDKSPPPVAQAPETNLIALTNSSESRPIPRRSQPIIIVTNNPATNQVAVVTNTPPTITCGTAQIIPCGLPDGTAVTLAVHVEDVDGHALSVVWIIDGKERETTQVPAADPPVRADLTLPYTVTPGDHAIKVTVNNGLTNAFCETTVTIQKDTQPPVIACPRDIALSVDPGTCTAVVTFSPKATDNCPDVTVTCDPPSGTPFPIGVTTVSCVATDVAGNKSDCGFSVAVQVGNICPKNDGFWRQNLGAWPLTSMTLGNQVYTRSQLVPLLRASVPADASLVLARQLIVATLNIAAGSDPRPICRELAQANSVLGSFNSKLPYRVNVSSGGGQSMIRLSTLLGSYNSGLLSSNCFP